MNTSSLPPFSLTRFCFRLSPPSDCRCSCPPRRLRVLAIFLVLAVVAVISEGAAAWPQFFQRKQQRELPAHGDGAIASATVIDHSPHVPFYEKERLAEAQAFWQDLEAKGRISPCWKHSLELLQSKCATVRNDDTMRSRLALFMATCDAQSDGRAHPSFHCSTAVASPSDLSASGVRACVRELSDSAYSAFLQYRLHADVLCAYIEEELYQQRTEAAVAAMQLQLQRSTRVLSSLQRSGAEVASAMGDTQRLQQEASEAASALRRQLDLLHNGQAAALLSLQDATQKILQTSSRTDVALEELHTRVRTTAEEALASIQGLSEESLKRFSEVEAQTRGVARLMAQMDSLHHLLIRNRLSWYRLGWGFACMLGMLFITSPSHTAAARIPAATFTFVGSVGIPLVRWWTGQDRWLMLPAIVWEGLCGFLAVGLVVRCAYLYTSPLELSQRVAREEALRVWDELRHYHHHLSEQLPNQERCGILMAQPYAPRAHTFVPSSTPTSVTASPPLSSPDILFDCRTPMSLALSSVAEEEEEGEGQQKNVDEDCSDHRGATKPPQILGTQGIAPSTRSRKRNRPSGNDTDLPASSKTQRDESAAPRPQEVGCSRRAATKRATCKPTRRKK